MSLDREMLNEVVALLRPFMDTEANRRAWLSAALPNAPVLDHIVYSGPTTTFIINMLNKLEGFIGEEAIWMLLKTVSAEAQGPTKDRFKKALDRLTNPTVKAAPSQPDEADATIVYNIYTQGGHFIRQVTGDYLEQGDKQVGDRIEVEGDMVGSVAGSGRVEADGDITGGDKTDFSGANINAGVFAWHSTLTNVTGSIGELPHGTPDEKAELAKHTEELSEALEKVPEAHQDKAEKVTQRLENFVEEMEEDKPDETMLRKFAKRLQQAAEDVAFVTQGIPIVNIASRIVNAGFQLLKFEPPELEEAE